MFDFLKEQSADTDIFCFQEVFRSSFKQSPEGFSGRANLFSELCELLPDHEGHFEKTSQNHDNLKLKMVDFPVDGGQAIFVKKVLKAAAQNTVKIYEGMGRPVDPTKENLPTSLQNVEIKINGKLLQVYNYHGITFPGNKLDTPERLEQSSKIVKAISVAEGEKILCGDFNLTINTESVNILASAMKDLIKEFYIKNTRNEISWKIYNNKQNFADFTFVSLGVKAKNFEVPYTLISDHLPMILEFDII